jgi:hypothetical protein
MPSHKSTVKTTSEFLVTLMLIATVAGCKSESEKTSTSDSRPTEVVTNEPVIEEDNLEEYTDEEEVDGFDAPKGIIKYEGVVKDENENKLRTFHRLQHVLTLAQSAMRMRDSIFYARGSGLVGGPVDDSIRATSLFNDAWRAIDEYKQVMRSGATFDNAIPGLVDLTRMTSAEDSSENYLPDAGKSSLLSNGEYFFLGGAPFIGSVQTDEGGAFESPDGKLEMRFASSLSENANYILNFLLHKKNLPVEIGYGPPLEMYDGWSRDIRGIGSIIHIFKERVPVTFLTTKAAIPAELISVRVKLDDEGLGCVSDQPLMIFACRENISERDILAVYISSNANQKITFNHKIHSNALWTADLNDDGVDDVACVSSSFEGIGSDSMAELLWFVNVNGAWKIIDYAQMLDCT